MEGTVLLVHDAQAVRASARKALIEAGHDVAEAVDLPAAIQVAACTRLSLVFLPWLGRRRARETLGELRAAEATRRSRVIVWAEQSEIGDAAMALELGADDCVALPFDAGELVARVNACLRRPLATMRPDELTAGSLVLDKAMHRLTIRASEVALSPAEFRLLAFLLENQGRVFSREELLRGAWPKNIRAGGRTVDVHVRRLRQLLEPFGCDDIIQTVRSFGYRLVAPARESRGTATTTEIASLTSL